MAAPRADGRRERRRRRAVWEGGQVRNGCAMLNGLRPPLTHHEKKLGKNGGRKLAKHFPPTVRACMQTTQPSVTKSHTKVCAHGRSGRRTGAGKNDQKRVKGQGPGYVFCFRQHAQGRRPDIYSAHNACHGYRLALSRFQNLKPRFGVTAGRSRSGAPSPISPRQCHPSPIRLQRCVCPLLHHAGSHRRGRRPRPSRPAVPAGRQGVCMTGCTGMTIAATV